MKKNVLIFPAGTEIAFEIWNALKYSKFVELYGATSVPCHAEFIYKNYIEGLPNVDEADLVDCLNEVIKKYNIDYIYPAHDSVVLKLTQEREKLNCKVVTSDLKTVKICRSKDETYKYLINEPYIPKTFSSADSIEAYPVFVKPAVGQGSNGAQRIDCREDLIKVLNSSEKYVICEYLPGEEYTVDCFTDRHGELRVVKMRDRERIRAGIAVRSKILETDEKILKIAKSINSHFSFNGAWFFQVKKNVFGEYRLLEASPRIPGTMGASRNLGINFPLLTLYNVMGYDVDIFDNGNELLLDRAFISRFKTNIEYDYVYIDFDDTIIVDSQVNTELIMFLYQANNQGKKIILVTKHDYPILESLKKYKISADLFFEIKHISRDDEKYKYITEKKAIFIDDSFAERKEIYNRCHIPVFDLDTVESLIDWRM